MRQGASRRARTPHTQPCRVSLHCLSNVHARLGLATLFHRATQRYRYQGFWQSLSGVGRPPSPPSAMFAVGSNSPLRKVCTGSDYAQSGCRLAPGCQLQMCRFFISSRLPRRLSFQPECSPRSLPLWQPARTVCNSPLHDDLAAHRCKHSCSTFPETKHGPYWHTKIRFVHSC
jgi:hypothetical protein